MSWNFGSRHKSRTVFGRKLASASVVHGSVGYTRRAKVEATIGRWKQVIGDGLRSRMDERRATDVSVAVHVLNRMLALERPSYVRIA